VVYTTLEKGKESRGVPDWMGAFEYPPKHHFVRVVKVPTLFS
jgi:hypothetical protein